MALNETITNGETTHIADHAALKAEYDASGGSPAIAAYTSSTTSAQHATIHNALHTRHNALGSATTLLTNLTGSSTGNLAAHSALHAAYNLRTSTALPAAPAAPSVSAGAGAVTVSWVAPSNGGSAITGYDVQRFVGVTGGPVTSVGNVLTTTISGLTNGTSYTFKVRAKNAVGNGPYSAASVPVAPAAAIVTSGLRGWWKADAITTPPADGGNMVSWTDSAGANPFLIVDGNPPVYRSSGSFLPALKPVVEFTAASSQDMGSTVPNNTATTKVFVVRLKTLPTTGVMALSGKAGGVQVNVNPAGKVTLVLSGQFGLITGGTATLAVNTWYVIAATSDAASSHATYVNGVQDATSTTLAVPTATSVTLGSPGTGGDFLNGYIAEAIDYNRVLTGTELTQVADSLTSKYSLGVAGGPTAGYWLADLTSVPVGSAGNGRDSGTATALELRKQWDYWDQSGASVINPATDGLTNPPLGKNLVIKWQKPAGTTGNADQVYQKMNRTFTNANWPQGSAAPVSATGSPADLSGRYVTYRWIPSSDFVLNPAHGWFSIMSWKENYRDVGGGFHQDGTGWKVGGNNFGGSSLQLSMTDKVSVPLSNYMDRWVKFEYRIYQGAKDLTGNGGRIEWWADDVLIDTGYEGDATEGTPTNIGHVGSANYAPLARTEGMIWVVGQYTSNQTTGGTPDYVGTHVTSYIGPTWVAPL